MNSSNYPQYIQQDDEIDLFELAEKLWARKLLIIAITAVISLAAVAIALYLPPTWQAETRIYTSSSADLTRINSIRQQLSSTTEFTPITPENTYNLYHRYLTSRSTLRTVFHRSGLAEQALTNADSTDSEKMLAAGFESFNKALNISASNPKKDASNFLTVRFDSNDQAFSAALINDHLLPIARQKTTSSLSNDLSSDLQFAQQQLNHQLAQIEREFLEESRLKTLKLSEALAIAKAGGITSPSAQDLSAAGDDTLFLLGSNILTTQLEIQKKEIERYKLVTQPKDGDSERPLLAAVAPLYLKAQSLSSLNIQLDQTHPVTIDEPAMVPSTPIKPKKTLIAALGVVLGGMLGVFIALIQIAVASRKEKQRKVVGSFSATAAPMTAQQDVDALRQ